MNKLKISVAPKLENTHVPYQRSKQQNHEYYPFVKYNTRPKLFSYFLIGKCIHLHTHPLNKGQYYIYKSGSYNNLTISFQLI